MTAHRTPYWLGLAALLVAVGGAAPSSAAPYTWTGTVNNQWSNDANWSGPGGRPTVGDTALIDTGDAVDVQDGDRTINGFNLGPGTASSLTILSGHNLRTTTGVSSVGVGSSVTNNGGFYLIDTTNLSGGGDVINNGDMSLGHNAQVSDATVTNNQTLNIYNESQVSGGTLINNSDTFIHHNAQISGGTVTNTGNTFFENNARITGSLFDNVSGTVNFNGANQITGGALSNNAQLNVNGHVMVLGTGVLSNGSSGLVQIADSGSLRAENGAILNNHGQVTNRGTFENDGTLTNHGIGVFDFYNIGTVNNRGMLVNQGYLNNDSRLINYGTLENAGILTNFAVSGIAGIANYGTLTNTGSLRTGGGFSNSEELNNNGEINLSSTGRIFNTGTVNNGGAIRFGAFFSSSNREILTAGEFLNDGIVNNSGTIEVALIYSNTNSVTADARTSFQFRNTGVLSNSGVINSPGSFENYGIFSNDGLFNNAYGRLVNSTLFGSVGGSILLGHESLITGGSVNNNAGRLIQFSGNMGEYATIDSTLINDGRIDGAAGAIHLSGDVSGEGSYAGTVVFSGNFSLGASPTPRNNGMALVQAETLNFMASNALFLEVGGLARGTEYDAIDAISVTLDGLLNVALLDLGDSFSPLAGDTFDVIVADQIFGNFASFEFAMLSTGLSWSTNLFTNQFGQMVYQLLVVSSSNGVPAPGAMLLLLIGCVGLVFRRAVGPVHACP